MAEKTRYQQRGPSDSRKHNESMRALTSDFADAFAKVDAIEEQFVEMGDLVSLDSQSITLMFDDVRLEIEGALSSAAGSQFYPVSLLEVVKNGSGDPSEEDETTALTNPLFVDPKSSVVTLPQGSYTSKLRLTQDEDGTIVTLINPEVTTAYAYTGVEDSGTTTGEDAIDGKGSTAFIVEEDDVATEGFLTYYVKVPMRSLTGEESNVITLTGAPLMYCRLMGLQYTTDASPTLSGSDNWEDCAVTDATAAVAGTADFARKAYYPPQLDGIDPNDSDYIQSNLGSRRYYIDEERITAIRVVLGPRVDSSGDPVPLTVEATDRVAIGVRDIDIGHVSFADTGDLVWDVELPAAATRITAVEALVLNDVYVGTYTPTIVTYYESAPSVWTEITVGSTGTDIGGETSIRIKATLDIVNQTMSPVIAGFNIEYDPT